MAHHNRKKTTSSFTISKLIIYATLTVGLAILFYYLLLRRNNTQALANNRPETLLFGKKDSNEFFNSAAIPINHNSFTSDSKDDNNSENFPKNIKIALRYKKHDKAIRRFIFLVFANIVARTRQKKSYEEFRNALPLNERAGFTQKVYENSIFLQKAFDTTMINFIKRLSVVVSLEDNITLNNFSENKITLKGDQLSITAPKSLLKNLNNEDNFFTQDDMADKIIGLFYDDANFQIEFRRKLNESNHHSNSKNNNTTISTSKKH